MRGENGRAQSMVGLCEKRGPRSMLETLRAGDRVRSGRQPQRGIGKVVYADAVTAVVYFKDRTKTIPEARLCEFGLPTEILELVPDAPPDIELDHLPPYSRGGGTHEFKRKTTELTIKAAQDLFFRTYPLGFNDPGYFDPIRGEREYKVSANRRYLEALSAGLPSLASRPQEIRAAVWRIYDGQDHKAIFPLNLLHPKWEAPRFFNALDDLVWAPRYLSASLAFAAERSAVTFDALADVMEKMPGLERGLTGRWPYATWFPFIADPMRHIALRLTYIEEFASAATFDIAYSSELNFRMYERVCRMAEHLLEELDVSGLNTRRRLLDMIDAQSFMWVARRYSDPGFEASSA
jgi:hypothetical protein